MLGKKTYRLALKERIQIETLLNENKSKSYISKTLKRSRSTITREVKKWTQPRKTNTISKYNTDLDNKNITRPENTIITNRTFDAIQLFKIETPTHLMQIFGLAELNFILWTMILTKQCPLC